MPSMLQTQPWVSFFATVSFVDETSVKAYVKGTDSEKDLAVIAVSLEDISDDTMEEIAVATIDGIALSTTSLISDVVTLLL